MRKFLLTAVALTMLSPSAYAAPYRNAKGKFIKCTTVVKATKAV